MEKYEELEVNRKESGRKPSLEEKLEVNRGPVSIKQPIVFIEIDDSTQDH